MAEEKPQPETQEAYLLLIVVGAHLRAEVADRPLAYRLAERIHHWIRQQKGVINVSLAPVVCSDIWYMNQEPLQKQPTISLGGPGVNAFSAFFSQKLNSGFVRENEILIQLDPELVDLRVCIWGIDHRRTIEALELFCDRYLDGYLRAVATQVEPQEG